MVCRADWLCLGRRFGARCPKVGAFGQVMKARLRPADAGGPQSGGEQIEQAAFFLGVAGRVGEKGGAGRRARQGRPRNEFEPDHRLAQHDMAKAFFENQVELIEAPGRHRKPQYDMGRGFSLATFFVMQHQHEVVQGLLAMLQPPAQGLQQWLSGRQYG